MLVDTRPGPYASLGLYDGATQAGIRTGTHGPDRFFGKPSDLFYTGEAGTRYELAGLPGRIGIRYWRHTGMFDRFDGTVAYHADGSYLVWDQTVFNASSSDQSIGVFARYGMADQDTSEIVSHANAGIQINALMADRPNDVTGLMASYIEFSDFPGAGLRDACELPIEAFHEIALAGCCP